MGREITNREKKLPPFGQLRTAEDAGRIARAARRARKLTLDDVYATTSLSLRFLSEFERGKPNASLGRALRTLEALGLDIVVVPRPHTASVLRDLSRRIEQEGK
jgi:transcriptional regulator with XRE-family HTH domain